MAYRDEEQHLRARVADLEEELAAAHQRIRVLEQPSASESRGIGERLAGGKVRIVHEQELVGELPPEAHEEIIEVLRRRYNVLGQASSVGKSLAWSNVQPQGARAVEVSVSVRNGKTTVRGVERLGNLAGALFGGIVGGVGGGGMAAVIPLAMALGSLAAIPLLIVLWVTLIYAIVRFAFSRVAAVRERELRAAIDEVTGVARSNLRPATPEKVRVADGEARDEAETPDDAEGVEARRARRE